MPCDGRYGAHASAYGTGGTQRCPAVVAAAVLVAAARLAGGRRLTQGHFQRTTPSTHVLTEGSTCGQLQRTTGQTYDPTPKRMRAPTARVNDRAPKMDDAEVRASHTHPPVRCSGERARRPAGQVQANLGGARAHPRAGAQGRVLAAQGVRPPRGLSCQRSPATATIQHRALRRWSCSRARRRHSRRTSSDCTVQPSVGLPSRTRSCTS